MPRQPHANQKEDNGKHGADSCREPSQSCRIFPALWSAVVLKPVSSAYMPKCRKKPIEAQHLKAVPKNMHQCDSPLPNAGLIASDCPRSGFSLSGGYPREHPANERQSNRGVGHSQLAGTLGSVPCPHCLSYHRSEHRRKLLNLSGVRSPNKNSFSNQSGDRWLHYRKS